MKYFVQLKDDVVFAYHSCSTEVDIPGDNIIEVESDGEKYLNKKYENGNFVDAPTIKYAVLEGDKVVQINHTVFLSEATGPVISSNDVKVMSTWDGTEFHNTEAVSSVPVSTVEVVLATIEPIAPTDAIREMPVPE